MYKSDVELLQDPCSFCNAYRECYTDNNTYICVWVCMPLSLHSRVRQKLFHCFSVFFESWDSAISSETLNAIFLRMRSLYGINHLSGCWICLCSSSSSDVSQVLVEVVMSHVSSRVVYQRRMIFNIFHDWTLTEKGCFLLSVSLDQKSCADFENCHLSS